MRQKKVLGLVILASFGLIIFGANADTTGSNSSLTWANNTGTNLSWAILTWQTWWVSTWQTGWISTGSVTTGTNTTWNTTTGWLSTWQTWWPSTWWLLQSGSFQIVIDPITKKITIIYGSGTQAANTGSSIPPPANTGTVQPGSTIGTEFQQALSWMFNNGLTRYSDETDYRPDDNLTREEVAKIIWQAYTVLGYTATVKNTNCSFSDMNEVDPSLSGYVVHACQRGLFKGSNGKFLPRNTISRPEAIAVLIRMFEGKTSNESKDPRRGDYYLKAWALGLTTVNNQTAFNQEISRREIAIYIARIKNIILDPALRTLSLGKISDMSGASTQADTGVLGSFESLNNSTSVSNDPELQEAIRRMNDNGLTSYTGIAGYKPFEVLNREQAAKILYLFGGIFNFVTTTTDPLPAECSFRDIDTADGSLMTYIEKACQANIMKGSNSYFSPKVTMNKAQFITAMVRMFQWGKLDESANPRRINYFQKAQSMGIVSPADLVTFENSITRYEVALFLYRFKVKYQMLQNINNTWVQNEIISTVPGSITTGINNTKVWNVYVDMNLLENGNFEIGYIEIFGTRYKVVKTNTDKYFSNNFVRYGDLYSLDTDEKIGTTSFIVSNGYVVEGAVRLPNSETYQVLQLNDTKAYYQIKQIK